MKLLSFVAHCAPVKQMIMQTTYLHFCLFQRTVIAVMLMSIGFWCFKQCLRKIKPILCSRKTNDHADRISPLLPFPTNGHSSDANVNWVMNLEIISRDNFVTHCAAVKQTIMQTTYVHFGLHADHISPRPLFRTNSHSAVMLM